MDYNKLALELHEKYKGKITTSLRDKEELNRDKLSAYYSPGVGAVSQAIAENPADLTKIHLDKQFSRRNLRRLSNFGLRQFGTKSRHASHGRKSFII